MKTLEEVDVDELRIDAIVIGNRHRADLGDLTGLTASIAAVGLLHPIVVTTDRVLIAGRRRLEACTQLGWKKVPVTYATSARSARDLLIAERDENTARLDMKPSEKVSLGLALEKIEQPHAEERRRVGQAKGRQSRHQGLVEAKFASTREPIVRTADIVGAAVGMSRTTYKRAKHIVVQARAGNPAAVAALAKMDATGKVTRAYDDLVDPEGTRKKQAPPRKPRKRADLNEVLDPLRRYLKGWDESHHGAMTPATARRLLKKVGQIENGLYDLHRFLETRGTRSRALD